MVAQPERLSPREHLDGRIAALDAEVERIWAEEGDPAEALGRFLVDRFGIGAIVETYREYLEHEDSFLFDDWQTEDGEDATDDGGPAVEPVGVEHADPGRPDSG